MTYIEQNLIQAKEVLEKFTQNKSNISLIEQAANALADCLGNGGTIMSCGNGGSMCDSMHFVEELTGRFRKDRRALKAISMGDPSHITCVANDFGYEHIFSRNVEAWGSAGDCLLAISTSGNSQNVIKAAELAKSKKMVVIGLLGKSGGKLKDLSDFPIIVESDVTERIQEIHIKIIHAFIEGIERQLFPSHY